MTARVRIANRDDEDALETLVDLSTRALLVPFLSPRQVAASLELMKLDPALIDDGTYFVAEEAGAPVACGGWSRRRAYATPAGAARESEPRLDPARDPARVRAVYTHPAFARRGLGRLILGVCERSARDAGFVEAELLATMAGAQLFRVEGWHEIEHTALASEAGVEVPLIRMGKRLAPRA